MAVTILLAGGLGNQMFQFAAAKSLALRHDTELVIDLRFLMYATERSKQFQLGEFNISDRVVQYHDGFFSSPHRWPQRARRLIRAERLRTYIEPRLGYNAEFEKIGRNAILIGNFQSPLYFEHASKVIAECFQPLCPNILSDSEGTKVGEFINVHVRRGDYLRHHGFSLANPLVYYANALQIAKEKHPRAKIRVFSDDVNWCLDQAIFRSAQFVAADPGASPLEDMARMANGCALIIANSSYSWWAGYLASRHGRDVYAPSQWISSLDAKKLKIYLPQWTVVEVS